MEPAEDGVKRIRQSVEEAESLSIATFKHDNRRLMSQLEHVHSAIQIY
jgi:hypothetical protein